MKTTHHRLLSLLAAGGTIVGVSAVALAAQGQSAAPAPAGAPSGVSAEPKRSGKDNIKEYRHHPHIHRAIHELNEAKKELTEAAHDFGGHRVEAIKAVDEAKRQLELALAWAREHDGKTAKQPGVGGPTPAAPQNPGPKSAPNSNQSGN